ncbi:hypothetical protein CDL15_Pgr029219 [Punica granatum]|uniref:Uncharacterized protein n=1 Tax=Punica granatum TaxID=22663 RepID=A0A218XDI1_PUNGR|nr:hypothetical protein CDL15_Pgr029219 [Punica granatum]
MFKDKTSAERDNMFASDFSSAQGIEGNSVDGTSTALTASSASAASVVAEDDQNIVVTKLMEFKNLEQFKIAVRDLNISIGRKVDFVKNDTERVMIVCVEREIQCSESKATKAFHRSTGNSFCPNV